jgi:hypothetical protein
MLPWRVAIRMIRGNLLAMLVEYCPILSSRMVSLVGIADLLPDRMKLKLPAERAKDAEASWKTSTLQGILLSQPYGLGLGLGPALQEHSPGDCPSRTK